MSRVELGGTAALTAGTERAPKPCRWCRSFHPGGPLEAPVVLPTAPAGFSSWQNPNGKTLFLPPLSKRFCKRCPGGGRVPAPPTHRPLTDVAPPLSHSRSLSATADPPRQAPAPHRPFPAPSARGFQHNGWETAPGTAPGPPPEPHPRGPPAAIALRGRGKAADNGKNNRTQRHSRPHRRGRDPPEPRHRPAGTASPELRAVGRGTEGTRGQWTPSGAAEGAQRGGGEAAHRGERSAARNAAPGSATEPRRGTDAPQEPPAVPLTAPFGSPPAELPPLPAVPGLRRAPSQPRPPAAAPPPRHLPPPPSPQGAPGEPPAPRPPLRHRNALPPRTAPRTAPHAAPRTWRRGRPLPCRPAEGRPGPRPRSSRSFASALRPAAALGPRRGDTAARAPARRRPLAQVMSFPEPPPPDVTAGRGPSGGAGGDVTAGARRAAGGGAAPLRGPRARAEHVAVRPRGPRAAGAGIGAAPRTWRPRGDVTGRRVGPGREKGVVAADRGSRLQRSSF